MKFKSLWDNCEGVWVIMGEGKEKKRKRKHFGHVNQVYIYLG